MTRWEELSTGGAAAEEGEEAEAEELEEEVEGAAVREEVAVAEGMEGRISYPGSHCVFVFTI